MSLQLVLKAELVFRTDQLGKPTAVRADHSAEDLFAFDQ